MTQASEGCEVVWMAARRCDSGPDRIALLEEGRSLAAQAEDVVWEGRFLADLVDELFRLGPVRVVPLASECIALIEAHPWAFDRGLAERLLKSMSTAIWAIDGLPSVTLEQWFALMESYRELLGRLGAGERDYWFLRAHAFTHVKVERSLECFGQMRRTPRGWNLTCPGCECSMELEACLTLGLRERADRLMAMIEEGVPGQCDTALPGSLDSYVDYFLDRGQVAEALPLARRSLKLVSHEPRNADTVGTAMRCFAYADQDAGLRLLQQCMGWVCEGPLEEETFHFCRGAWALLREVARGRGEVALALPASFEGYESGGVYDADALAEWFWRRAEGFARACDERDGNTYLMDALASA